MNEYNPSIDYKAFLLYWIEERWNIYQVKTLDKVLGQAKPWSLDPIFQTTYFCNVHRENDKVTKWIRENWSPGEVGSWEHYEFYMVLARFLNWPDTLAKVGAEVEKDLEFGSGTFNCLHAALEDIAKDGKVWGNAYVITSHGMPMPKATYLCQHLLPDVYRALPAIKHACRGGSSPTCGAAAAALQTVPGIGSFLAGQIVADLKNTPGHPLFLAQDKKTFVIHGPGSLRGLSWFHYGVSDLVTKNQFNRLFTEVRIFVDKNLEGMRGDFTYMPYIDNQDLQNCLCEFDKYCRVKTGTGRSKRKYDGR